MVNHTLQTVNMHWKPSILLIVEYDHVNGTDSIVVP